MKAPALAWTGGALLGIFLLAAPFVLSAYLLSVLILILYFAFVGQAWNLMMGFAGQLSLGNALYVGLGAYVSAALFVHLAVPPALGVLAAAAAGALAATVIGALAFRFGISGVHFALLTIAFAEFARLGFAHLEWTGANSGLFLPVRSRSDIDLLNLRGPPILFYYLILALVAGALALVHRLMRSPLGYSWLAIREEPEAAQSLGIDLFRARLAVVATGGAMTAVGGVFLAFYTNTLFPSDVFGMHRSIEIILAPIIGGLGTFLGPVVGAVLLGVLGETATAALGALGIQAAGAKQLVYTFVLLLIVMGLPGGVWPWLWKRWTR
ncbi:MAG: branched-chain amino acid ABC transporter permease [Parvibaculaceae bacterium]